MSDSEPRGGPFAGGRSVVDRLREAAAVESVYGDPVVVGEKTVVPVARIAFGFGGGAGSSDEERDETGRGGEGWGGGGGVRATPVGVLEVTDRETRWIRFEEGRRNARWLALGLLFGLLLGRRGRRRGGGRALRRTKRD